jgi:hypothetical protein
VGDAGVDSRDDEDEKDDRKTAQAKLSHMRKSEPTAVGG